MLPFVESFGAIVAALFFPTLLGLFIVVGVAKSVGTKYLAAFTLGIYLWFFSDTIGDSSYLDVNSAFSGGIAQIALLVLFAVGVLIVFSIDRTVFRVENGSNIISFSVPLLLAFAIGFHGFGEGADFAATAAATPSTNLLTAFGGAGAAVAFILHKGLEPMMIGAAYWIYARGRATSVKRIARDILVLTIVFILPGIVGAATDYYWTYEVTYFFAFGLGTSLYALMRLAKPLFWGSGTSGSESVKVALILLFGFFCIYFAALFHSL